MGIDLKHFKSFNHNISNWSMKERIYIFVSFLALTLSFMVLFIYFIKVVFRHHKLYFGFTFLGKLFYLSMLLRKVKQYSLREKCPHSKLFWSVFCHIRTEYGEILAGKYGPEKLQIRALFTQ